MPSAEAEKLGAEHEFGAKYPEKVSVYSVGQKVPPQRPKVCRQIDTVLWWSSRFEYKRARTLQNSQEEAVAQGVRRIKAVLEIR